MNYVLTTEGRDYLASGLPEKQLVLLLTQGPLPLHQAQKKIKTFSVALQWAKKHGWVHIEHGTLSLRADVHTFEHQNALERVAKNQPVDSATLTVLEKRKLIERVRDDLYSRAEQFRGKEVTHLSEDLIKSGIWKDITLKSYTISAIGKKQHPGKRQPYGAFLDWVKQKMVGLGFQEMTGPIVETEFWNMDALYMPQHHSARDIHDAYFVKDPEYAKQLPASILRAVKKTHQSGTDESRGWEYQYDVKRAHRLILRTHDTAISPKTLSSRELRIPGKYFQLSRCFRYDVIDATHLPDFYQLGGFIIDEDLTLRHLIGLLKTFAKEFAQTDKIKVMPSYFPFTEPSAQLMAKHPVFGWLELAGAGIFRHEMNKPLGVTHPVIAWGAGIDRIFMMSMGINDIRQLFSHDLEFLRASKVMY